MAKKKFKETKVGQFLKNAAPNILDMAGDILPDAGVFSLIKNLISKDTKLPVEDKEKALKLLEQDMVAYFGSRGVEKYKTISNK